MSADLRAGPDAVVTLASAPQDPGVRPDFLNLTDLICRGWSIFPLRYKSKKPAIASWLEYQKRHLTVDELEQWFSRPPYNVAIVTGKISRIFVVDADSAAALAWCEENLPPCDLRVRSSGGVHLYYPYSADRPMRNKVRVKYQGEALDFDLRCEGGYVCGPGSVHESGHIYAREGSGWAWR